MYSYQFTICSCKQSRFLLSLVLADLIFQQQRAGLVYFLGKTEPRIYIVAIYTNRRAERDMSIITALTEVLNYLRLNEVFSLLRTT